MRFQRKRKILGVKKERREVLLAQAQERVTVVDPKNSVWNHKWLPGRVPRRWYDILKWKSCEAALGQVSASFPQSHRCMASEGQLT